MNAVKEVKFSPMLASPAIMAELKFPLLGSPKLDGVRALHYKGVFASRSLKKFKNRYVNQLFDNHLLDGLDGELIIGSPTAPNSFIATNSVLGSFEGQVVPTFYVFDRIDLTKPYTTRLLDLIEQIACLPVALRDMIRVVPQILINNLEELNAYEEEQLGLGYEGVMVRSLDGPYKLGRSTASQGWLLKIKRFQDDEAVVLDIIQMFKNGNEATTNALGHTERSSHQENLIPLDMMGALRVRDLKTGVVFQIGTGFTHAQRKDWWDNRMDKLGLFVKYQHFAIGGYELPRFPSFKGERMVEDIV